MDAISTSSRPDVLLIESASRPTPAPARVSFGQVLAAGANSLVQGAELAASRLAGASVVAASVRGSTAASTLPLVSRGSLGDTVTSAAEGPAGTATSTAGASLGAGSLGAVAGASGVGSTADSTTPIDASLQQSAQMNFYYLQIQQEMDAQNRSFTTLSNVLKTEHDTAKAAIQNVHS